MQLAGELAKITLPSLIQMVRNGELTGKICLTRGVNTAFIFVDRGRIKHVESDLFEGRDALLELFLWTTGTFSYIDCAVDSAPVSISSDEPAEKILKEGQAYAESKKYLDQLRIGPATVLKASGKSSSVPNPLLNVIDGRTRIRDLAGTAELSRFDHVRYVYQLVSDGLALVVDDLSDDYQQIVLPEWVISRLKQDNPDVSKSIVQMVIWVDRIKCWMYQADADLERLITGLEEQYDVPAATEASSRAPVSSGDELH